MSTAGSGVFCPRCGTHNPGPSSACTNCGAALPVRPASPAAGYPPAAAPPGGYPSASYPPAGYPPSYPPSGYPGAGQPPGVPAPPSKANTVKLMTIVLVIAGLFVPLWPISLPLCWFLAYQSYKNP